MIPNTGSFSQQQLMKMFIMESAIRSSVDQQNGNFPARFSRASLFLN
jgi:hypothetical protein